MLRPPRNDDAARAAAAIPAIGDSLAGLRRLTRKYSPDQPRAPAGNPDGGQWTGGSGGTGGSGRLTAGPGGVSSFDHATGDPLVRSRTSFHPDGTRIASTVKDGGALAGGSERYTVIAANGDAATFETVGRTQTIYGPDGKAVARNEWTSQGAVPVPLSPTAIWQSIADEAKVFYLGLRLQQELLRQQIEQAGLVSTPIVAFKSRLFQPGNTASATATLSFVGEISEAETKQACPKTPIVERAIATARAQLGPPGPYDTPQKYGNAFHALLKNVIKNLHDPDLRAEISYLDGKPANYGTAGSVRYDVLEDAPARKLCIHDLKTGQGGLTFSRSTELARYAGAAFRNYTGFYVIEHRAP